MLYYDIFSYPLKIEEIFTYLPGNSLHTDDVRNELSSLIDEQLILEHQGYYFLRNRDRAIVDRRLNMELHAGRSWKMARFMTAIIKRFPFIRAVFVSGDLSMNLSDDGSDIDFFVVTEQNRLWIARTLLVLFKKIVLLNRRKFFCINYYLSESTLEIPERDLYIATEIMHLKPLFNLRLYQQFLRSNSWVRQYFPNFEETSNGDWHVNDRNSIFQRLLELPFLHDNATRLDRWIMNKMIGVWEKRYPTLSADDRRRLFRCEPHVSTAHPGDFQTRVMSEYRIRLKEYGVAES